MKFLFFLIAVLREFRKTTGDVPKYKLHIKVILRLHYSSCDVDPLIMDKCNAALYSGKPIEITDHKARNSQISVRTLMHVFNKK